MQSLKVLYIFDKYLNRTMNWAHRMISYTPNIKPIIASPIIVKNEFFEANWDFIISPFQLSEFKEEDEIHFIQKGVNYLIIRRSDIYKNFLKKKIEKIKPDLIHIHFGNVAADFMDIAFDLNIPLVATFHGYDYEMVPNTKPHYVAKYQKLLKNAAAVTVGGGNCEQKIIEIGSPAQKVFVVPQGIEPENIHFRPKFKEANSLSLFQACALNEKKGVIYTVKAFIKIHKKCPNSVLKIACEVVNTTIKKEIDKLIANSNLQGKITFLNLLPYPKLIEEIEKSDVFIHPSVTATNGDRETAPVVMMDAQAAGTPCISSTHSDIPEIVLHNKTGLLAAERDVDALAKHIERFYKMENEEYQRFANEGRKHIEKNYDIRTSGKKIREVYNQILNRR